jgi:hypothetical protein
MYSWLKRFLFSKRGDAFAQTAIVLPVVMLATMGLLDMTMAGFAGVNANNAANYGARIGSVTQRGAGGAAYSGALASIAHAEVGDYTVGVSGGGHPGALITVQVDWEVPNHFASITTLWGGAGDVPLAGTSQASFRQEGW